MLKHWLWLAERPHISPVGIGKLLRLLGSAESIYELTEKQCLEIDGFEERWLPAILDKSTEAAEKIIARCDELEIQILTYGDEAYPRRLRQIDRPPVVLYYQGSFPNIDNEAAIAIVGTRKCSNYGLLQAKQFAGLIASSGGLVVSGGARGIDSIALNSALNSLMPVVCVVGCGLDQTYPKENRPLFEAVVRHGCMVSEYPPGTPPRKLNFPMRNRIISALSVAVLVVEAPKKSGALITADLALEQGKDLFTLPGNIGVRQCEGSNRILQEGAQLATDGWDLLSRYEALFPGHLVDGRLHNASARLYRARYGAARELYSPQFVSEEEIPARKPERKPVQSTETTATAPLQTETGKLSEDETAVLSVMDGSVQDSDQIVVGSGLPVSRTMAALTLLQIKKLVRKAEGNRYQRI